MLGGVLGSYIQGGVTFKGGLLFSVYGMPIYIHKRILITILYLEQFGARASEIVTTTSA